MKRQFFTLFVGLLLLASCNQTTTTTTAEAPKEDPSAKALAQYDKMTELMNSGKADEFIAALAPDAVDHPLGWPEIKGRDSIAPMLKMWFSSVSNVKMEILHKASDGERVFAHYRCTGDMAADGMGMKIKGGHFDYTGTEIMSFNKDGLVNEHWDYPDMATFAAQVGMDLSAAAPPAEKKK